MNIILISKRGRVPTTIQCSSFWQFSLLGMGILLICSILFFGGYYLGSNRDPETYVEAWRNELNYQKKTLASLKITSQAHIDALTARIGELHGYITRLDALGNKLVKMAKLQENEFDFENPPALGGPAEQSPDQAENSDLDIPDLSQAIFSLNKELSHRENQLLVLEEVLRNRNLHEEVYPTGTPVSKGWISSYYGYRNSPFGGRREFHKGIDFAGKEGNRIVSVAGGVVTWAGKRYGYGNLVEINHGNGYITRYGHNKEMLVKEGQAIKKGEVISLMGSTGRSTGPHVHFEVLYNGRQVDPITFIQKVH